MEGDLIGGALVSALPRGCLPFLSPLIPFLRQRAGFRKPCRWSLHITTIHTDKRDSLDRKWMDGRDHRVGVDTNAKPYCITNAFIRMWVIQALSWDFERTFNWERKPAKSDIYLKNKTERLLWWVPQNQNTFRGTFCLPCLGDTLGWEGWAVMGSQYCAS